MDMRTPIQHNIYMEANNEILKDFQQESNQLIVQLLQILEECEDNFSQVKRLEDYGQTVDRIMGAAKSIAITVSDKEHFIHKVGDYTALCKAVGYKASQIKGNEQFYNVSVALLLDATEMLSIMIENILDSKKVDFKSQFSATFLDRLRWVSAQFGAEYKASVDIHKNKPQKLSQNDIDELLKKLGLD